MDLWAVARYDLRLSLEEFEDLTPLTFQALCKRRNLKFKMDRYAAAIPASAIYNVNRASTDAPLIEPMDFVREPDPYREQSSEIKKAIRHSLRQLLAMPCKGQRPVSLEQLQDVRTRFINNLKAQGRDDAEALFDECMPSLKRQ